MKARKLMVVGLVMLGVLLITAGVAFAAGQHSVNLGAESAADGDYATVGGGAGNSASGYASVVAGGGNPDAAEEGEGNRATGDYSVVSGGRDNAAVGTASAIIGGAGNRALGNGSVVLGAEESTAQGDYSMAAGQAAHARHKDSFAWRGRSERDGEFVVDAYGGVRLETGGAGLTLDGTELMSYIKGLEARIAELEGENGTPGTFSIRLQAEDSDRSSGFIKGWDEKADNGQYLAAWGRAVQLGIPVEASYAVSIPSDGGYYLWARLYGESDDLHRVYFGINGDNARWVYPTTLNNPDAQYTWSRVGRFALSEGKNHISAGRAGKDARLDALYLTSDQDDTP